MGTDIKDGYTLDSYIEGIPRLYPSLRFSHRPIIYADQQAILDALNELRGRAHAKVACETIAKYVVRWDAKDRNGNPVKLIGEEINANVEPPLIKRLANIVLRLSPSDPDPQAEKPAGTEASLESILSDPPVASASLLEIADAKN